MSDQIPSLPSHRPNQVPQLPLKRPSPPVDTVSVPSTRPTRAISSEKDQSPNADDEELTARPIVPSSRPKVATPANLCDSAEGKPEVSSAGEVAEEALETSVEPPVPATRPAVKLDSNAHTAQLEEAEEDTEKIEELRELVDQPVATPAIPSSRPHVSNAEVDIPNDESKNEEDNEQLCEVETAPEDSVKYTENKVEEAQKQSEQEQEEKEPAQKEEVEEVVESVTEAVDKCVDEEGNEGDKSIGEPTESTESNEPTESVDSVGPVEPYEQEKSEEQVDETTSPVEAHTEDQFPLIASETIPKPKVATAKEELASAEPQKSSSIQRGTPTIPKTRPVISRKSSAIVPPSSDDQEQITKKPPPRVPKKPSSKIAAFQQMLSQQQQSDLSSFKGPSIPARRPNSNVSSEADDDRPKPPSRVNSKFSDNLNGLFATNPVSQTGGFPLPGMVDPMAAIRAMKESKKQDVEDEANEAKVDIRRGRGRGPKGRKLPSKVKEEVKINDETLGNRVIQIFDLWSINPKKDQSDDNDNIDHNKGAGSIESADVENGGEKPGVVKEEPDDEPLSERQDELLSEKQDEPKPLEENEEEEEEEAVIVSGPDEEEEVEAEEESPIEVDANDVPPLESSPDSSESPEIIVNTEMESSNNSTATQSSASIISSTTEQPNTEAESEEAEHTEGSILSESES